MSFRDLMQNDVNRTVFNTDHFAETCVYTTIAGVTINTTCIPTQDQKSLIISDSMESMNSTASFSIKLSDVPSPAKNDRLTVGGVVWTVIEILSISYGVAKLACENRVLEKVRNGTK